MSSTGSETISRWNVLRYLNRDQFFNGLFVVTCANGLSGRAIQAVWEYGPLNAFSSTFGISVIVWAACLTAASLLMSRTNDGLTRFDLVVGAIALALTVVPLAPLSWAALSIVSLYVARVSACGSERRRGAMILLTVTVPMLWSRLVFTVLAKPILDLDAFFVSNLLGSQRVGNLVQFADGSGYLEVGMGCSSFSNLSLALLASVTLNQYLGRGPSWRNLAWYLIACAGVVEVNVTRITLIGNYPTSYYVLHGPLGAAIFGWITFSLIAATCLADVLLGQLADRDAVERSGRSVG